MSDKQDLQTDKPDVPQIEQYIGEQIVNDGDKQDSQLDDSSFYLMPKGKVEIKSYDPATQYKVIRDRFQVLDMINERFACQFRVGLFNLLHRNTDVIFHPIEIQPYHQFAADISSTLCLNSMHFEPLKGTALFVFSPELIYIVVDNLFGGDGRRLPSCSEGREFTHTEQKITNRVLQLAAEAYQEAWKDIFTLNIEYIRSEVEVKFTNITTSSNDIVVNSSFTIETGDFSSKFSICIPYSMIEPLRELLVSPPIKHSPFDENVWRNLLTSGIEQSNVELVVNFTKINTTVSQVLALKIGDVLSIEKPDILLEATVGAVPVLKGRYGRSNQQYAIQVEQVINPGLEKLREETANE